MKPFVCSRKMRTICTLAAIITSFWTLPEVGYSQQEESGLPTKQEQALWPLLFIEEVQKSLELTDSSIQEMKAAFFKIKRHTLRNTTGRMREERLALIRKGVLDMRQFISDAQMKRLAAIKTQMFPREWNLTDDDVAKKLGLSIEQLRKIEAIRERNSSTFKELLKKDLAPNRNSREKFMKAIKEISQTSKEETAEVLTEQQRNHWKALTEKMPKPSRPKKSLGSASWRSLGEKSFDEWHKAVRLLR